MRINSTCRLVDTHPIAKESPGDGTVIAVESRDKLGWIVADFPAYGRIEGPADQFMEIADTPPAEVVA